jgi:hypothetical protein
VPDGWSRLVITAEPPNASTAEKMRESSVATITRAADLASRARS